MRAWLVGLLAGLCGCHVIAGGDELEPQSPDRGTWAVRFGDGADQRATAAAMDGAGNIYVAGSFRGVLEIGEDRWTNDGATDLFVAKLDPEGSVVWSQRFACTDDLEPPDELSAQITDIEIDQQSANLVVVGSFRGELDTGAEPHLEPAGSSALFVTKLSVDGELRWSRQIGGNANQVANAVAIGPAENVFVVGLTEAPLDVAANLPFGGGRDAFFVLFSESGEYATTRLFGDANWQEIAAISVDSAGKFSVAGTMWGDTQFDNSMLTHFGDGDVFLAKLDGPSSTTAGHVFGNPARQCHEFCAMDVAMDADDNTALASEFTGDIAIGDTSIQSGGLPSVFVSYFHGDALVPKWTRTVQGPLVQEAHAIRSDADGFVLAGYTVGDVDVGGEYLLEENEFNLSSDIFVVAFGRDGSVRYSHRFGDDALTGDTSKVRPGPSLAVHESGTVVVAGSFRRTMSVVGEELASAGDDENYDIFVVKLVP